MSQHPPGRQIHLDFHTPQGVGPIAARFDPARYVGTLAAAGVDSVVTFAKCHHGWSYYDSAVGMRHPDLAFDLLRVQFDACKAAGIRLPIYVSVGWDELAAFNHPDWRQISPDGTFSTLGVLGRNLDATWSYLCLNSPYLDAVCTQIEELASSFPAADGFWLDIAPRQGQCCCTHCRSAMDARGLDWTREADRLAFRRIVETTYYQRTVAAARSVRPDMPVFHNQGHTPRGDRTIFRYYSHLDIESLPTGGWGYDHFPISARYAETVGKPFLGLTGRFHTVWGEFGGYKHPNALRYEAALIQAFGGGISIGDQLDVTGELDVSTYRLIGQAFGEARSREPWCQGSRNVADVAVLSSASVRFPGLLDAGAKHCEEDEGAVRMLLEAHIPFDVIDSDADLSRYRLLILPDTIALVSTLVERLKEYLGSGGCVLLTGVSGMTPDLKTWALDIGAEDLGPAPHTPTFILPIPGLRPDFCDSPFVMYAAPRQLRPTTGRSLGDVYFPYFNRSPRHFFGHQHTPARPEPTGFALGVRTGGLAAVPYPVFTLYRRLGAVAIKAFTVALILDLLGKPSLSVDLPSQGRATLRHQPDQDRHVLHLLYATPALRGMTPLGPMEVIEDLPTLHDIAVRVRLDEPVAQVRLVPDGDPIAFERTVDGVTFRVPRLSGSALVEICHR